MVFRFCFYIFSVKNEKEQTMIKIMIENKNQKIKKMLRNIIGDRLQVPVVRLISIALWRCPKTLN